MNFKKSKYYIILSILLIAIVSVAGFMTFGKTEAVVDPSEPDIIIPDPEEPEEPTKPDDNTDDKPLTFKNWYKLYTYASDMAYTTGFTSTFNMTVISSAPVIGDIKQVVTGTQKCNPALGIQDQESWGNNNFSSEGVYYHYAYFQDGKGNSRRTLNADPVNKVKNFGDEPIDVWDVDENYRMPFTALRDLEINEKNCKLSSFDKVTSKDFYIIKLAFKLEKLPESYLNSFNWGIVKGIEPRGFSIEIRVNKKSNKLYSITSKENYNVDSSLGKYPCESVTTQKFQIKSGVEIIKGF